MLAVAGRGSERAVPHSHTHMHIYLNIRIQIGLRQAVRRRKEVRGVLVWAIVGRGRRRRRKILKWPS